MGKFMRFLGLEKSSNGSGNETDVLTVDPVENGVAVDENIFVDNNPPANYVTKTASSGKLMTFFNQDFRTQGFREGYANHSKERMTDSLNKIKADFRFEMDQLIGEKKAEILKLGQNRIEIDGISAETVSKIDMQLKHIDDQLTELESQKALSAEDEGWIMKALREFQIGYANGTKAYHDENKFLGFNELFN